MMLSVFVAAALSIVGSNLPTQNLNGEARMFPADIGQGRAVIVVTFSKSASDEGSAWTRKLRENQQKLAATIYQIAILEDVPGMFRSFVISALKRTIPKDLHDRFWIATSSSKDWQEQAASNSLGQAHVLVLENFQIRWRFHGPFSESALQSLVELYR